MIEIPAITVYQPWASLLAYLAKLYETRGWATKYRGPIAIHAAAKPVLPWFQKEIDKETRLKIIEAVGPPTLLPLGCVIATAELAGCHLIRRNPYDGVVHFLDDTDAAVCINGYGAANKNELLFGDWKPGRYAWEFKNMQLLPEPIPAKGMQGLWKWKTDKWPVVA